MDTNLIKPYEISIWEDKLIGTGVNSHYEEKRIVIIGSNTMTSENRAYDPVFTKNANGSKTLTFSMKYKYFEPLANDLVVNPFINYLINERKVKLKYDGKWYDFIIREKVESSDELTWSFTATDAFVLELSKNGYELEFNNDLNNNQGTAIKLAEKTLENTDWVVADDSHVGKQKIAEPIYNAVFHSNPSLTIIDEEGAAALGDPENVYVFYSYVANKDGHFVQLIKQKDSYTIDDNNTIIEDVYRIENELVFDENTDSFKLGNETIIEVGEIETHYHAYRLGYGQLTTYDPIVGRLVDRYTSGENEVYGYTETIYSTSDVVVNYVVNGENFDTYDSGGVQGWSDYTPFTPREGVEDDKPSVKLTTYPELKDSRDLVKFTDYGQVEGYLEVRFTGALDGYNNTIFNNGIDSNIAFLKNFSEGERFVFRVRASETSERHGQLDPIDGSSFPLGLIVAKYDRVLDSETGKYLNQIDTNNIILNFSPGEFTRNNNEIHGGVLNEGKTAYSINDIIQAPSTKYIYYAEENGTEIPYIWAGEEYVDYDRSEYISYYYSTATVTKTVTEAELRDLSNNYGIFLYTSDPDPWYYIQDIQLTRFYEDENGEIVTLGNIPTTTVIEKPRYYYKPSSEKSVEEIEFYSVWPSNLPELVPIYNEDNEKVLSISVSQSNRFNILQTIAETFECWVDLDVERDESDTGAIKLVDGKPIKKVHLREFIGKDNWAGFKYAVNLGSIERTVNSDEIVTKLIVNSAQSNYNDKGVVTIQDAASNTTKESYILDFSYYLKQGLVNNPEQFEADVAQFNLSLTDLNKQLAKLEDERINIQSSLTTIESKRNVFVSLIDVAEEELTKNLGYFEQLTGETYAEYCDYWGNGGTEYVLTTKTETQPGDIFYELVEGVYKEVYKPEGNPSEHGWYERKEDYINNEDVRKLVTEIYNDSNTINSYSGLATNLSKEAEKLRNKLESDGGLNDQIDEKIEAKKEILKDFYTKYSRFIQEGTWSSNDYIDSELYYLDALQVSKTSAQPKVTYSINVVEISSLEGYEPYAFDAGDKTYIEDTEFFGWADLGAKTPAREEVIVSEVEWHLDEPQNNVITVSNYKTQFEDLFQRINATVQTVQYNEATYAKTSTILDANGTINQDLLLASLNKISGSNYNLTSDGSVIIDGENILIQNLTNLENLVKINSSGLSISSDGGQTWTTAITGRGVNVGAVTSGSIDTDVITIGGRDQPSFRWDSAGLSAYKNDGDSFNLQTFVRYDQYGLYGIKENGDFKATSLEEIKNKAHFALTWDGFFIKNSYDDGGRVSITSDNDFQVIDGRNQERIKIGSLGIDSNTGERIYGINISNKNGDSVLSTDNNGNLTIEGTIYANAGEIGGMSVDSNTLRMNHTVFEKGVGIYSDINVSGTNDPVFIISDVDGTATFNSVTARGHIEAQTGTLGDLDVVDTITVGADGAIESNNWSSQNHTGWHIDDAGATFNNANVRGTITALQGDFLGEVRVGPTNQGQDHIIIDGTNALIKSSNYQNGAGYGWMINKDGDAVFNNITARGAIKTAVFEYAEIQAVGGIFIFRPSSTIKAAEVSGNNLVLTLEKPHLFQVGDWCKVSNYIDHGGDPDAMVDNILLTNGLTHVYEISAVNERVVTLSGAAVMVQGQNSVTTLEKLVGGALVDMGNKANGDGEVGTSNYGIGINSSDNTVNLPRRAISLFETVIDETQNPKVSYQYRGILGTLPTLPATDVSDSIYNDRMAGTQGIYTDNMYIGDNNQFIAFYEDENGDKQLRIKANQVVYEVVDEETGQVDWHDVADIETEGVPGPPGEDAINVIIDSSSGNMFLRKNINTTLTCYVYRGTTDITNQVTRFTWSKKDKDGNIDSSWVQPVGTTNSIIIGSSDVASRAIFTCEVEF